MRRYIIIFTITITLSFFLILEIFENHNKAKFNNDFNNSISKDFLDKISKDYSKVDSKNRYKSLSSNIDYNFNRSNSLEIWNREMRFIENKNSNLSIQRYLATNSIFLKLQENIINLHYNDKDILNNKKKILLIGDSFVAGYSQERYNLNYFKILERFLNKEGYHNDYSIISLGRPGSFYDYIDILDKYYNIIKPDIIIFGLLSTDYIPDLKHIDKKYLSCIYGDSFLINSINFIPDRYQYSKRRIIEYICSDEYVDKNFGYTTDKLDERDKLGRELFLNAINKLKNDYKGKNIIFANTEPPYGAYKYPSDEYYSYAINLLRDNDFKIINMNESNKLRVLNRENNILYINPFDWHPGADISYQYAKDIFSYLNKILIKGNNKYIKDKNIYNFTNAIISKIDVDNFTVEKILSKDNLDKYKDKNIFITYSHTDLYNKNRYPSQLSYCAKYNRAYDIYEFNDENKFLLSINKSEHEKLFIINYYYLNNKLVEDINLLQKNKKLLINQSSLGFIVATPDGGCKLDKVIDTGLYKLDLKFIE
jgi:hypothetical protein